MNKPQPQATGETYYSDKAIQPIEYTEANNLTFHEGSVIKYITRWRQKGGVEDLRKARWYVDRLIELEEAKPVCGFDFGNGICTRLPHPDDDHHEWRLDRDHLLDEPIGKA